MSDHTAIQPGDTVVNAEELAELRRDAVLLNCLRNAGVDNWEGWDYALEAYQAIEEGEDA